MADYPYTQVTGKLKSLLDKIRTVGIPAKVSFSWIKTIGFTSSNDNTLIGVLKFVGLIDGSNIPTPMWTAYRGATHRVVLGDAVRQAYSELYAVYPDAHARSNTELSHVFSTSSTGGQQVITKTISTFKALVQEAEFSASPNPTALPSGPLHTPVAAQPPALPNNPAAQQGPEVHIDIQIHTSTESSSDQIDKIFDSMARHLYGRAGKT